MAVRRVAPAAAQAPPPPVVEGVNFGDLGMYAGDFLLPKGDYCMFFDVLMFKGEKSNFGERLSVRVAAYPLDNPTEEHKKEQIYSMGSKAHLSFAPNPNTGKGLVSIPGAVGATLPPSSNWGMFLKSLYDSGLPQGTFTNDLTTIDGIWAHVEHVDEPAERAGFQSATGEAPRPENSGPRKIAVVTEILEGGKPWEGTGGIPAEGAATPAAPAAPARPALVRPPAARPAPAPARAAAPAPAATASADDIQTAAVNGLSAVLEKNLQGLPWLQLRNQAFSAIKATNGDDMASAVTDTYFGSDDAINGLLGQLGYVKSGPAVKVA